MAKSGKKTTKKAAKKAPAKASAKSAAPAKASKSARPAKKNATSARPASPAKKTPAKKAAKIPAKTAKPKSGVSKKPAKPSSAQANAAKKASTKTAPKKKPAAAKPAKAAPRESVAEVDVKSTAIDTSAAVGSGLSFLSGKPGSEGVLADTLGEKPRLTKSKLGKKDLDTFRDLLLDHRRRLHDDIEGMEREALQGEGSNLSHLPVHMADMGTDNYEQEFTLGLADRGRRVIDEIDHALEKIGDGTYGICEGTGQMIAKPRLQAQPWVRYSIEYARSLRPRGGRR